MTNLLELWNKSAEEYKEYALKYPQYIKTNEKLIDISEIKSSQVVVDLGWGTGLTTKEILKRVPDIKKIYAVDFSEGMINIAREFVRSKKVVFIVADVKDLLKVIPEKVDVILCNSSFGFFPNKNEVVVSIKQILKNDGIFAFNLGSQNFDFEIDEDKQTWKIINKTIFFEMAKGGYAHTIWSKPKINENQVKNLFENNGFSVEKIEYYNIGFRPLEDIFCFYKIPVMATATFVVEVPKEEQKQILNSAYNELKNKVDKIENNKWIYFLIKKNSKP